MKKVLLFLILALGITSVFAQAPQKFNYQAVARTASGDLITETALTVRIGLIQDEVLIWQEDHYVLTNGLGLFSLQIGSEDASITGGTVGGFEDINWSTGSFMINVQIDRGSGFEDLGSSELVSVPFALHAANGPAGPQGEPGPKGDKGDPGTGLTNKGIWASGTQYNPGDYVFDRSLNDPDINSMWILEGDSYTSNSQPYLDGAHWVEFHAPAGPEGPQGEPGDPATDDQTLVLDGAVLSITGGNEVDLSGLMDADADPENEIQDLKWSLGRISLTGDPDNTTIDIDSRINTVSGWSLDKDTISTGRPVEIYNKMGLLEQPLFEVKNSKDVPVFAVFEDGVIVYVDESKKGIKGGFAVGGYNTAGKGFTQQYAHISPDSVRFWVPEDAGKGVKGGFAVGGYNTAGKGDIGQWMSLTKQNYLIGHDAGAKTTGINNSFIGYQAGANNIEGHDNIFLGNQAGLNNQSAYENVFIGNRSGFNTAGGYGNVFVGNETGFSSNKGYFNTFVGYQAGYFNYSNYNSFFGYQAGYGNENGAYNLFMGHQAGYNNTSGGKNIFLGYMAGYAYSTTGQEGTGTNNIFLGNLAGYRNTSGTNNIMIGNNSGQYNTSGQNNIFLGNQAGYKTSEANDNIFLGNQAGLNNDLGTGNIMIGYMAGSSNIGDGSAWDGNYNVFIGYQAGTGNTVGTNNIAIGYQAAQVADSSDYFTAIGFRAGNLADGQDNTFIGGESGYYTTSGDRNTFLGHISGRGAVGSDNVYLGYGAGYNGDGSQNVAIGSNAGWGGAGDGNYNTFVGYLSGAPVTTGAYNAFFGHGSGRNISSGSNNTFIGRRAGYSTTTGSGNVFIGNDAGYSNTTASNMLYISNSSTSTPLIYGNFSTADLTINGNLIVDNNNFRIADDPGTGATPSYFVYQGLSGSSSKQYAFTINDYLWVTRGAEFDGDILVNSTTYSSDRRYKHSIRPIKNSLNIVKNLEGVYYRWKTEEFPGKGFESEQQIGLIAQDVEEILPEVVSTGEDGYKSVDYAKLSSVLIEAIKEQQEQIEKLEQRIKELENK